ncbi:MAG: S8 family serine peptidase, partial [Ilumatobacteraceae bacterium]
MMRELLQRRAAGRVWERRRIARWSALGAASMFVGGAFVAPSAVPMAVGTLRPMTADIVELQSWDAADGSMSLSDLTADLFASGVGDSDGSGVDVALIDTGVAPVDGLDGADKVMHGPDLSFEGAFANTAYLDTYGHGTHMAGIIAGERDGDEGVAPGARIISIKTAGHDGVTTVPQVIAAIDWVVDHHDQAGLNIRVLNLSLGQANICNYRGDYLSAAVERAWQAGIVVVVAAGNDGETQRCLNSPAIDPYVVAVGTADALSSPDSLASRVVPSWSGVGDGKRNPDVVAQGRSIASYRVPGSTIDQLAPNAAIDADSTVGTGTSQAAAVTSGVAARLIGSNPSMSNDQIKATLLGYAVNLPHVDTVQDGYGHLDAGMSLVGRPWTMRQNFPGAASGGGRGGMTVPTGSSWSGGEWSGSSWSGSSWSGQVWSGSSWSGSSWSGSSWSGSSWSG